MTTTPRSLYALPLLLATALAGCDADAPEAAAIDYRAVGHVELSALTAAPWMKGALKDGKLEIGGTLGPCADVLHATDAVTFGAKEDAFEVYLEGSFDAAAANACGDHIDAEVAARASRLDGKPKPEATLLRDGVFVVFGGDLTPSPARLEGLAGSDPSGGQPMWITANMTGKSTPVDHVEAWADPSRGLSAHAEVVFADEAKATELYGKATLGLAAMSLSDEVGELASAVDLDSSGASVTAEITLSATQMKGLVAKGKARHEARMKMRTEAGGHHEHGVHIQIGTSE